MAASARPCPFVGVRPSDALGHASSETLLRALELAALLGFPEYAIYEAGALAAQLREMLLADDAPAPQNAGEAEALARMGTRRALVGPTRAPTKRGG